MIIERLRLVGYLRLSLRQIEEIDYRPKEKVQIILGSNGSGKSQLLKELSPLPANDKEYTRPGSKEIWISHDNKQYILRSLFTVNGNQFEFICDDEELNPGKNVTTFKELVKTHFNYTADLHALRTGKVLFHQLSSNDRRKLFMSMNHIDFTYALKYFNRLKEQHRDCQGMLERLKKRLAEETDSILSADDATKLKEELVVLHHELDMLISAGHFTAPQDLKSLHTTLENLVFDFGQMETKLLKYIQVHDTLGNCSSSTALQEEKKKYELEIADFRKEISLRMAHIVQIEKDLTDTKGLENTDLQQLLKQVKERQQIEAGLRLALEDLPYELTLNDASTLLYSLQSIQPIIIALSEDFSSYPRSDYTRDDFRSNTLQIGEVSLQLLAAVDKVQRLKVKVDEYQAALNEAAVVCVACGHQWKLHYHEDQHMNAKKELESMETQVELLTKKKSLLQTEEGHMRSFAATQTQFSRLYTDYANLSFFLDYLVKLNVVKENPARLSSEINMLQQRLMVAKKLQQYREQNEQDQRTIDILTSSNAQSQKKIKNEIAMEESRIGQLQNILRFVTEKLSDVEEVLKLRATIQSLYQDFMETYRQSHTTHTKVMEEHYKGIISEMTHTVKEAILKKERQLSQIDIKQGYIGHIRQDIERYTEEQQLLAAAIDSLSPKTGLIARGLTNFINRFIEEVNLFIERVWTYPLSIKLIEPEENDELDLDYKFSVNVNDSGTPPDIANTSSGMQEIIHLACVRAIDVFLNLNQYPVYLDEFAARMDDTHRKQAYNIIEYLIEDTDISQVFMVSHFKESYSSLTGADITVLCDANINLPSHLAYNQRAYIK